MRRASCGPAEPVAVVVAEVELEQGARSDTVVPDRRNNERTGQLTDQKNVGR